MPSLIGAGGNIRNLPPEKYLLDRKGISGFGRHNPHTFETLRGHYPFVKSEEPLVEKAVALSGRLSEFGETPLLIGGVGMRFNISAAFRQSFNGGKSDGSNNDVDFVLPRIPDGIAGLLARREIEVLGTEFNGKETEFVVSKVLGSAFHLKDGYGEKYPLFSHACYFPGEVCNFRLNSDDFGLAAAHYVESGGSVQKVLVADTALLVATNLKPHAASEKRMKRAVFAVMANNDRLPRIALRVAELFERMEADRFELEKTLRGFYRMFHKYSSGIADGFIGELGKALPAARRVRRLA